jgi:hypothetical protein
MRVLDPAYRKREPHTPKLCKTTRAPIVFENLLYAVANIFNTQNNYETSDEASLHRTGSS